MTETNRYNNGKIYKLVSNHTDKIYIGSTCKDRLCQRFSSHKSSYGKWLKNEHKYMLSFELFKLGDVEIILLESVNCETKEQLLKKEREYIDRYKDIIINKINPFISKEEKREYEKKYLKKYYEENKDKNICVNVAYQKYMCECGISLRMKNKPAHIKSLKHQAYLNTLQQ